MISGVPVGCDTMNMFVVVVVVVVVVVYIEVMVWIKSGIDEAGACDGGPVVVQVPGRNS